MEIIKDIKIQKTIPIHTISEKYVSGNYFKGNKGYEYTEIEELWDKIEGICIVHMYPEEDTIDVKTGELNGYESCLFFRTLIYNVRKREMYNHGLHDGIDLLKHSKVQTFKDMSTMITIDGGCKIGMGQSFTVYPL